MTKQGAMMIFQKLLNNIASQRQAERLADLERSLIRHEAKIGGELFGPVPKGVKREFFCLDEHTWVWHEEWTNANGQKQSKITRYSVRPTGILKSQDNQHYQPISVEEAVNLNQAAKIYQQRIKNEIYSFI